MVENESGVYTINLGYCGFDGLDDESRQRIINTYIQQGWRKVEFKTVPHWLKRWPWLYDLIDRIKWLRPDMLQVELTQ